MKRKYIALLLAALMLLSTAPAAFAAPPETPPGPTDLNGNGTVFYIESEIYEVTVPTTTALNFTIDPQGVASVGSTPVLLSELQGGRIIHNTPAIVVNNSSRSLKVTVALKAATATGSGGNTATATFIAKGAKSDADTIAAVTTGSGNNVLIYAVPSAANISDAGAPFAPAGKGYILKATDITLDFIFGPADYLVTNDGTIGTELVAGTGHGTGIQLGGYVDETADWTHFAAEVTPSTVSVVAKFTYATTTATAPASPESGIYGLETPSGAESLELTVPVGFAGGLTGSLSTASGANVNQTVPFNFDGKTVNTAYVYYDSTKLAANAINASLIFDDAQGTVGIKGNWSTAGTVDITFKLTGSDVVYTLTVETT